MRGISASAFLVTSILLIVIASVSGRERGTIYGVLTDSATGDPVASAAVLVVGTQSGAITDSVGAFRIRLVDTGSCEVRVSHLDYRSLLVPDLIIQPDSCVALSRELTKKSEKERTKMRAIRKAVEKLVESLKRPITNIKGDTFLVAYPIRASRIAYMVDSIISDAIQDPPVSTIEDLLKNADGVITNEKGEVFIRGKKTGFGSIPNEGEVDHVIGGPAAAPTDSKASALTGFVIDAETGKGIKGVSVIVVGTDHRVVTDSQGNFVIDGIIVGKYELLFSCKGYHTSKLREAYAEQERTPIIIHGLERATGEQSHISKIRDNAVGYIRGILTDSATGEPICGASVMLIGTRRGAMTDFDGKYVISGIPPGTYTLEISHLDYATVTVDSVVVVVEKVE